VSHNSNDITNDKAEWTKGKQHLHGDKSIKDKAVAVTGHRGP
jgi:hypothetical protein